MGKANLFMSRSLVVLVLLLTIKGFSQSPLQPLLKNYFRSHPFDMKFSSFILSLQQDPWFKIEEYKRRDDTAFFFLRGTYKNWNPFRFTPREIRLIIAEDEIIHKDSMQTHDTIINLQIMGIMDSAGANSKHVEKEFRRFHNNQEKNFYNSTYDKYERRGATIAESYNYFIYPLSIAPVSIAWGRMPNTMDYTFTIIIRFKVKGNMADFIFAPDDQL